MSSGVSFWSPIKISSELLWASLAQAAAQYASGRLVDIGCGTKPYKTLFAPHITSYFGIDFENTSDLHYGSSTQADLYVDCTDTKLEAETFDTLLSTQVIEHIYDTHAFIVECNRLLKKGGTAIFTIPFVWENHAEPFDYYRFTKYSIDKLFKQHGFEIIEIKPLGGAYATLIQTKIITIYCRPSNSFLYKIFRRIRNALVVPVMNIMALHLDRLFWSDKICLNYIVIARKADMMDVAADLRRCE